MGAKGGRGEAAASVRDFLKVFVPLTALVLAGIALAYRYVDPAPPKKIRIAAGVEDGAYTASARAYAEILAKDGLTLEVVTTSGSMDNLRLLSGERGGADVAFVQGGTVPADAKDLVALGSVFLEPLWVFVRADRRVQLLTDLKGRRVAVGVEGSGTRVLALQVLQASGVADPALLVAMGGREAVNALLGGSVDAAFFVTARPLPMLEALLRAPTVRLFSIPRADAFAKHFRFLSKITLPEGGLDLAANVPPRDVTLLAPAAALVAREDLHPALIDELLAAATEIHGPGQLFSEPGEFPSTKYLDLPLSPGAARFHKSGMRFLRRYLPFWAATLARRFLILLIPIVTLLIPVLRFAPQVYRWGVRRRVYRWYKDLRVIEDEADRAASPGDRARVLARLDAVERKIARLRLPAAHAESLYHLKNHTHLVRRLIRVKREAAGAFAEGGTRDAE
jgi:TRAP transporter TAXI family solute receptor